MKHRLLLPLAVGFVSFAGVCDPGTVDVFPELEEMFSFETGLEGWSVGASGLGEPPSSWDISVSSAESVAGVRSVGLFLDNTSGQGRLFIRRRFDLAPDTDYRVELGFLLGTVDAGNVGLWNVIAGASMDRPQSAASFITVGDSGGADGTGVAWVEKTATLDFRTAANDGRFWVGLGIWGTSVFPRQYYVDDLAVTFRRR